MEDDIVERLRKENPEQFLVLVRMHLSFIIDMNTDENDSPTDKPKTFKWGFSKKLKNVNENGYKAASGPTKATEIFSLTEENINQLYQLIDVLTEEKNVCQEGIFRRTGSLSRQQLLRKFLTDGGCLNNDSPKKEHAFSVHDMASVLKGILADTPEPLLLHQHYQAYCHLATTCFNENNLLDNSETRLIGALRLLLLLLPKLSLRLANRLLLLLHRVASHEDSNRMSPSALATMFAPHVMCPRKQSPESLHADSQNLAPILSFMIMKAPDLFVTPPQLATDILVYFTRRQQRRLLSPQGEDLNESVTERTAANTVFTFVDRQMSGTADQIPNAQSSEKTTTTFTDAALAQLYAHIQALPESQNKRRLIKQFNRENGHGTPLQLQRAQKQKSIGQSLKKHIFNKSIMSKTLKKSSLLQDQGFGYQSIAESPTSLKVYQNNYTAQCILSETPKKSDVKEANSVLLRTADKIILTENNPESADTPEKEMSLSNFPTTPHIIRKPLESNTLLTSTPHVANVLMNADIVGSCSTPIFSGNHIIRRGSMSPITKSTQKMPKAMQESIMTPRSRKPVVIKCDAMGSLQTCNQEQVIPSNESSNLSNTYESFSTSSSSIKNDSDFVSTDESCPSKSYCIKYKRINDDSSKEGTNSLQIPFTNITKSAYIKKKKRIFQEAYSEGSEVADSKMYNLDQSDSELINNKLLEISDGHDNSSIPNIKQGSLTDPFRHYLLCRSVLVGSPVDLSFISEPDDFCDVNMENVENIPEDKMTTSLMYCLDGHIPSDLSVTSKSSNESITDTSEEVKDSDICKSKNSKYKLNPEKGDKENVSPNKKRNTQSKRCNSEYESIEIKKVMLTQCQSNSKSTVDKSNKNNPVELIQCNDFWDFEKQKLRETNL